MLEPKVTFSNGAVFEIVQNAQSGEWLVKVSGGPFAPLLQLAQLQSLDMPAVQADLVKLMMLSRLVMQWKAAQEGQFV